MLSKTPLTHCVCVCVFSTLFLNICGRLNPSCALEGSTGVPSSCEYGCKFILTRLWSIQMGIKHSAGLLFQGDSLTASKEAKSRMVLWGIVKVDSFSLQQTHWRYVLTPLIQQTAHIGHLHCHSVTILEMLSLSHTDNLLTLLDCAEFLKEVQAPIYYGVFPCGL